MSLRDQIAAETTLKKGPPCMVAVLLSELTGDDRQAVVDALGDPKVPATAIDRALLKEGHRVGANSLQRHRRRECACESV
ncbi:MAG TPA: hypothetical protein VIG24_02020 [Acidimicrobiia bacterium]